MNRLVARISAVIAVATLATSVAVAAPGQKEKGKKVAAAMTCPVCKMPLSTKKTKENPTAVKIGKKTYYCCAQCPMPNNKKGGTHKGGKK